MEVTKLNFSESLPKIKDSINRADFLVIDAEFTGLINGKDVSIFDSPQEYYTTLLHGSSEFLLIQYGLAAFYWDDSKKCHMNDTYNFYLFPRGRPGPEKLFLCQSSSLDFLAAQGFDFNKLIREGISFMTEPTESRLRDILTERQKTSYENNPIQIPEENKQKIQDVCDKVRKFIDDGQADEMEIDRCNAFIRRLLFQELGARFKNKVIVETKVLENKNRILKVIRVNSKNKIEDRETLRKEKQWEELEDAVGFSKVARMISQSEKLVIGHNMLLDILHTLNHFFTTLPEDYFAFKEFAHCMFPKLLDTKYMSSLPPFKDKVNSSVLPHLLATLSEEPFSLPKSDSEKGRGYCQMDEKHHEAGYDAYVTGLCFLAMYSHLSKMRGEENGKVNVDSAILKPFLNKIFLAKTAHQDSPFMNLAGTDPIPPRDHVFHLKFPREWVRSDIDQLFSPFGPIVVKFLDDESALVALTRRDQAKDVQRALGGCKLASLMTYAQFKHIQAKKAQEPKYWSRMDEAIKSTVESERAQPGVWSSGPPLYGMQAPPPSQPRRRSRSVTSPATNATAAPSRKRSSSGVFLVDGAEPPSKKSEISRSLSGPESTSSEFSNGRQKLQPDETIKNKENKEKNKLIEKFDADSKTKCVSAFKESDSWD